MEGHAGNKGLGETVAVVNIGATVTDLSIIKDGILHFPRTIMLGGRSITTRISEGLQVSEAQAERLKRQYASVKPLPPELLAPPALDLETINLSGLSDQAVSAEVIQDIVRWNMQY